MPARHRRIVEADVGREAASDPRPFACESDDTQTRAVMEREDLALGRTLPPSLLQPRWCGWFFLDRGLGEFGGRVQGGTHVPLPAACGACGQRVSVRQGHDIAALLAPEGARPGHSAR